MNIIKLLESLYGTTCHGVREAPISMVGAFFILTNSLNGLIKSERFEVPANNTTSATLTLSQTAKLVLSVYCDGKVPITIDRYSSNGQDIVPHFATALNADTRIMVVYI